jgi:hypothetical protein
VGRARNVAWRWMTRAGKAMRKSLLGAGGSATFVIRIELR